MYSLDHGDAGAAGPSPFHSAGSIAAEVVRQMNGGAIGLQLFGSRAGAMALRVLDEVRPLRLSPVRFVAEGGTVVELRARVERTHAARADARERLLLVIDDADRLDDALLSELEDAAAAAAEHGGLFILFATPRDLAARVGQRNLPALARCVIAGGLHCDDPPAPPSAPAPVDQPQTPPVARDRPAAQLPRLLMVAGGILAGLTLLLVVGITHLSAPQPAPSPPVAALTMPPALLRPPPSLVAPLPLLAAPPIQRQALLPASPPVMPAPSATVMPPPAPVATISPARSPVLSPAPAGPSQPAPASLLLIAGPGDTLLSLYAQVYRGTTPPPLAQVAALNPTRIGAGTRLVFPPPPAGWSHTR